MRAGRLRPMDSSAGRRLASERMRVDPDGSLRDIARAAGIAPSTVLDVRNRLSAGEAPVPIRREGAVRGGQAGRRQQWHPAADEGPDRHRPRSARDRNRADAIYKNGYE